VQYEETAGQPPAPENGLGSKGSARVKGSTPDRRSPGSGSARVSDPAETPDRRSPVSGSPSATTPAAAQSDTDGELPSVSLASESFCDDDSILRNEATDAPRDTPNRINDAPAGLAVSVEIEEKPDVAAENRETRTTETSDMAKANRGNGAGLQESVRPGAELPPPIVAPTTCGPTDELRAALALLTPEQLLARRWAMFQARRR
jgi:hypothetical protein